MNVTITRASSTTDMYNKAIGGKKTVKAYFKGCTRTRPNLYKLTEFASKDHNLMLIGYKLYNNVYFMQFPVFNTWHEPFICMRHIMHVTEQLPVA